MKEYFFFFLFLISLSLFWTDGFLSELLWAFCPKELPVNPGASFLMWSEIQACLNHCHVLVVELTERRAQLFRSKNKTRHIPHSPRCLDSPKLRATALHCLEIHPFHKTAFSQGFDISTVQHSSSKKTGKNELWKNDLACGWDP